MKVTIAFLLAAVVGTAGAKLVKVNSRKNLEDSTKPAPMKGSEQHQYRMLQTVQRKGKGKEVDPDTPDRECVEYCNTKYSGEDCGFRGSGSCNLGECQSECQDGPLIPALCRAMCQSDFELDCTTEDGGLSPNDSTNRDCQIPRSDCIEVICDGGGNPFKRTRRNHLRHR